MTSMSFLGGICFKYIYVMFSILTNGVPIQKKKKFINSSLDFYIAQREMNDILLIYSFSSIISSPLGFLHSSMRNEWHSAALILFHFPFHLLPSIFFLVLISVFSWPLDDAAVEVTLWAWRDICHSQVFQMQVRPSSFAGLSENNGGIFNDPLILQRQCQISWWVIYSALLL